MRARFDLAVACAVVVVWAITGPFFHYSDIWQLVINTGTTIVTFLMVFLIQNTQNRDSAVLHLKLDELIRVSESARNKLLDLENLTKAERNGSKGASPSSLARPRMPHYSAKLPTIWTTPRRKLRKPERKWRPSRQENFDHLWFDGDWLKICLKAKLETGTITNYRRLILRSSKRSCPSRICGLHGCV